MDSGEVDKELTKQGIDTGESKAIKEQGSGRAGHLLFVSSETTRKRK